jgi:prophage regulatory protein
MAEKAPQSPTILRRKQVEARVGLRRSTLYQRISEGSFPTPVRLGPRAVGWLESEITAWLNSRIQERQEVNRGSD